MKIRPFASHADRAKCVALQELTWGAGFTEKVPAAMLLVAQKLGGVVAGAFTDDGTMLGFVFGVTGVKDGRVRFDYSGRWQELFRDLTPQDVRWTCERLARLTPQQWQDAFRAAGYADELAARFIKRFQEKIAQGLALPG